MLEPPRRKQKKYCTLTSLSKEELGEGLHLWMKTEVHVKTSQCFEDKPSSPSLVISLRIEVRRHEMTVQNQ